MKIGVIGAGVVGQAVTRCWLEHTDEVRVYDEKPERRTHFLGEALACDLVFVCLPEASLDGFFGSLVPIDKREVNFVVKSTCAVGTTRRLAKEHGLTNLVHSPEFLTERCAFTDVQFPARNIIGDPLFKWKANMDDPLLGLSGCGKDVRHACSERFPGVPILCMTSDESEAVKLMTNAFAAVKVSLFNEFRSLADVLELDWQRVLEGILSDGRIGTSWTKVPGPDGKRGFGGRCLPKDLMTLMGCFDKRRLASCLTDGAFLTNCPVIEAAYRRNRDWDRNKS